MGIDAGFDIVPRLSTGAVDRQNWRSFLEAIKEHYAHDKLVEVKPNYVVFKAGEHPRLPLEGHKFLRFSSKISGRHAKGVEEYIDTGTLVAIINFGSRIRRWNEAFDEQGFYDWQEVHESFKSYNQADEPAVPTTIAQFVFRTDPIDEVNLPLFDILSVPDLATKMKTLSKVEQRQVLSLHNNFPGKFPFSGIVKTNALPCGSGSVIGGIYPTICRINHSCLPNAHNSWNSDEKYETIHAIRNIKSGEEITISYDTGGPVGARRTYLKNHFGFVCMRFPTSTLSSWRTETRAKRLLGPFQRYWGPSPWFERRSVGCRR